MNRRKNVKEGKGKEWKGEKQKRKEWKDAEEERIKFKRQKVLSMTQCKKLSRQILQNQNLLKKTIKNKTKNPRKEKK